MDLSDIQQAKEALSAMSKAARELEKGLSRLASTSGKLATGVERLRTLLNKILKSSPKSAIGYLKDARETMKQIDHLKSVFQKEFEAFGSSWEKHKEALDAKIKMP